MHRDFLSTRCRSNANADCLQPPTSAWALTRQALFRTHPSSDHRSMAAPWKTSVGLSPTRHAIVVMDALAYRSTPEVAE
jgi:hypothetical protein